MPLTSLYRALGLAACLLLVLFSSKQPVSGNVATQVKVTHSAILIDWVSPTPPLSDDGAVAPGYTLAQTPGQPQLPQIHYAVAIPAGAEPQLTVQAGNTHQHTLPQPFELAPRPNGLRFDKTGASIGGEFVASPADLEFTPDWVTFEEVGTMAGVRLGTITIHPVLPAEWPQVSTQVEILESAVIRLDFAGIDSAISASSQTQKETSQSLLAHTLADRVLNPTHVQPVRPVAQRVSQNSGISALVTTNGEAGMTQVTYERLKETGFPVDSIDLDVWQLFALDTEISWEVQGNGSNSNRLEAGESIVFYAPGRHSRWQTEEVFRLVAGAEAGQTISTASADPAGLAIGAHTVTIWAEQDLFYTPHCLCGPQPTGHDGDRWMWLDLKRPNKETASITIETPHAGSAAATLQLYLVGNTELSRPDDHRLGVSLNGTFLDDVVWDGKTAHIAELNIPVGLLAATNTVSFELKATGGLLDGVWLDAAAVTYQTNRTPIKMDKQIKIQTADQPAASVIELESPANVQVYDVSDPYEPIRLTGIETNARGISIGISSAGARQLQIVQPGTYQQPQEIKLAAELLTQQSNGGDIVMIVPAELRTELEPLIEHRSAQGYTVVVEEVERIFETYGHGEPNPAAIQAFLQDGWEQWPHQPAMVLLAGDGHYDPRNNLATSPPVLIPPFLLDIDPWMGETAADNRFVTFDGPDDRLPELALGRLPANSPAELRSMVTKIIRFETERPEGDWSGTFTFVADNADSAGDFTSQLQKLINRFFPSPWKNNRLFLTTDQTNPLPLINQIQNLWNSGTGLVMFMGHSSTHQWAAEQLFHISSVGEMSNGLKLPVVLQMSCFTGSFHYPNSDGLDETLMRHEDGGAIGIWGSTGLGVSTGHDVLADGFLHVYFGSDRETESSLGQATLAGKAELALSRSTHLDLLDTFTLFGDPATSLEFITPNEDYDVYLPVMVR